MSENQIEYLIRISPNDRYRHLHIKEKGKILYFRVQYETRIENTWYPVVRYDTAHLRAVALWCAGTWICSQRFIKY